MSTAPVVKIAATGAAAGSWTTASYTPEANSRELAFISGYKSTAGPAVPTITDTAGNNWYLLAEYTISTVANPNIRSAWYISDDTGPSPASRTATVAAVSGSQIGVIIFDVLSADTDGTLAQAAVFGEDLANGDPSCTFGSTPGASNLTFLGASFGGGSAATKPTGWTSIASAVTSTARITSAAYDITSASIGPNQYTSLNARAIIIGIELAPAGAGSQSITGALFSDSDTFYGATVAPGSAYIAGGLFSNANSFFAATVSATYSITGALFTDSDTFFGSAVSASYGIAGGLFADADTFYGASVAASYAIAGALYSDADAFYVATISNGSSPQSIAAALFPDSDTFYGAALTTSYSVVGSLFSDPDTYYGASASSAYNIAAGRFGNVNSFYASSVAATYAIAASLFVDTDAFYAATLSSGQTINGSLVIDSDAFFASVVSFARRIRTGCRTGAQAGLQRPSAIHSVRTPAAPSMVARPPINAATRQTPTQVQRWR